LVDQGDIDGISEYMYRLLINPELTIEMGKRARDHINENFNLEASIRNLRAILDRYVH